MVTSEKLPNISKKLFVNPMLSDRDYGVFRIGGPGLANCLIILGRAFLLSKKLNIPLLPPTWPKFSIGPWIRHEKDKRIYLGLFYISLRASLGKLLKLCTLPLIPEKEFSNAIDKGIVAVSSLGNYYEDFLDDYDLVRTYFTSIFKSKALELVPERLSGCVAVHIRLGDFNAQMRIGLDWYEAMITRLQKKFPHLEFLIFSDGSDEELKTVLDISHTKRVFFGNALADMVAISRCSVLLGSDSTFSGFGCFMGQLPAIFKRCHYGRIHRDEKNFLLLNEKEEIPEYFIEIIQNRLNRENGRQG